MGDTSSNELPAGSYQLELGSSFREANRSGKQGSSSSNSGGYHTIRYDFKPGSTTAESDRYIAFGSNSDVHVAVPSETGDTLTVFKGAKKDVRPKECLLFFDRQSGKMRLEQLNSAINVKKTRDLDSATEAALKSGIEQVRASERGRQRKEKKDKEKEKQTEEAAQSTLRDDMEISSSSSSSSSSDSDSDSDSSGGKRSRNNSHSSHSSNSDVESHLLEKMKKISSPEGTVSGGNSLASPPKDRPSTSSSSHSISKPAPATSKFRKTHDSLGLNLSESSDEDE